MMSDTALELDRLRFSIEKSLRYHQRRRAFFESLHRVFMFAIIFLGSAAAAQAFGVTEILAFVTALVGAIDLVWAPGTKARDHLLLHQRFSALMAEIARNRAAAEKQISDWCARRVEIEADEPPIYWALEKDCYNEVCHALGRAGDGTSLYPLSFWERVFMNLYRFDRATA